MSHARRFDHVGITVADLDMVAALFVGLGLEVEGRMFLEGEFLDTVCGWPTCADRRGSSCPWPSASADTGRRCGISRTSVARLLLHSTLACTRQQYRTRRMRTMTSAATARRDATPSQMSGRKRATYLKGPRVSPCISKGRPRSR
jgi:hypothetical protein